MKIFNIEQANYFVNQNCKVIGCALGNRCKIYIDFEENKDFLEAMKKWQNNDR
ncbi:MAG: hypothetical protein RSC24_06680 [Clostridium sp.]